MNGKYKKGPTAVTSKGEDVSAAFASRTEGEGGDYVNIVGCSIWNRRSHVLPIQPCVSSFDWLSLDPCTYRRAIRGGYLCFSSLMHLRFVPRYTLENADDK